MTRIPFVDLHAQFEEVRKDVLDAVLGLLETKDYILGKPVERFEQEFARFLGGGHVVGVGSGTDALIMALRSAGIGPGDEVITQANTFIATALAIHEVGALPVFADVEPDGLLIDPPLIERAVTSRTRAVLPVQLFGQVAEMQDITEIARRHDLLVIEDACQAHGATYHGQKAGTFGDLACFSFYPSKNLGGIGDGGALFTRDPDRARMLRLLRNYGQEKKNWHTIRGLNSRLDSVQAAVLRIHLEHLDRWNECRRSAAALYRKALAGCPVDLPVEQPGRQHVYHLFVIRGDFRDELREHLQTCGIDSGIHYPVPIHLQPAFKELGYRRGDFPVAEHAADRMLSLPMFPSLAGEQVERVAEAVRNFYAERTRT